MKHVPVIVALSILSSTTYSRAYDQQVSSQLSVEGYSVYSTEGKVISRRRVVEDLQLGAWNLLPGESDPYYRGSRLAFNGSLRVFGDMNVTRAESDPESDASFVPGLTPVEFDALTAYIDASGLWDGVLDLRAGRQIRLDHLGFFAFDGIESRMHLPIHLTLDALVGMEVRGGHVLGYDALELDGTDRGGRRDMEETSYPDREEPDSRLAVGTSLELYPWRWLEASAGFRVVGLSGHDSTIADERVGGRLTLQLDHFRSDVRTVFSPLINTFTETDAEIGVTPVEIITVLLDYHRFEPSFEGDSIFNVFDLTPQNDLGGRLELRLHKTVDVATWGFVRLSKESAGLFGDSDDELVSGAGGGVGGNYRTRERAVSLRLTYLRDWGESRVGAELGGGHGFLARQRLWLAFRLSFWHLEDDFSEQFRGNTAGYVLSGRFRIAHQAHFLVEFEHYLGDGRDTRFYALALLQMDLWR